MKKYISTNIGSFEVIRKPTKKVKEMLTNVTYWETLPNAPRTIWDAYSKPSDEKERIYKKWREWFSEAKDFRIVSHNCNFFSIAVVTENYIYYITKDNNYMIRMNQSISDMLEELRWIYK